MQSSSSAGRRLRRVFSTATVAVAASLLVGGSAGAIERCTGAFHFDVCAEQTGWCPADPSAGLINSDWAVFQHDVQHTGKANNDVFGPACASPHALWTTRLKGQIRSSSVVGPRGPSGQGILYVPASHNPICALDPTDGHQLWCRTTDLGRDVGYSSPTVGNGDFLYVGTRDNDLWALELPSPARDPAPVEWRQKVCTDGDVVTPPIIGADGVIYMGSDSLSSGSLFAMCPGSTRQVKWCHNPVGGSVGNVSPALSPDGTRLYITFQGSWLAAFDTDTGNEKWRVKLEDIRNNGRYNFTVVVHPVTGRVYVGFDTGLFAVDTIVDPDTQVESPVVTLLYDTLHTDNTRIQSPPVLDVANDTVFFGATNNQVSTIYAVALDGTLRWKHGGFPGRFFNNPPIIDGNGRVYFALKSSLYALDGKTGATAWTFATRQAFVSAPIVSPGRVYVSAKNGTVYAVGCDN